MATAGFDPERAECPPGWLLYWFKPSTPGEHESWAAITKVAHPVLGHLHTGWFGTMYEANKAAWVAQRDADRRCANDAEWLATYRTALGALLRNVVLCWDCDRDAFTGGEHA